LPFFISKSKPDLRELAMTRYITAIGCVMLACALSSAAAQQPSFAVPNNLFIASGFIVKYATTPEKSAILRSLPPDKLVKRMKDGKLYYVYADAALCNCAYVGTPEAYAAYQNFSNGPGAGGQNSNAMQTIDSDVGAPYIPVDTDYPSVDSILDPSF
jgi:hypothetical protein